MRIMILRNRLSNRSVSIIVIFTMGIIALIAGPKANAGQVVHCAAMIQSLQSENLCIKATSANDAEPVKIQQCTPDVSNATGFGFRWSFFDIGNANHEHFIRTVIRKGKRRMEVGGWSHNDAGKIQIWGPNADIFENANNQKWRLEPHGDGVAALISVLSNKCLDVPLHNGNPRAGDQLQQFTCHFGRNQLWKIIDDHILDSDCNRNEEE
jgi:hypothetical protein